MAKWIIFYLQASCIVTRDRTMLSPLGSMSVVGSPGDSGSHDHSNTTYLLPTVVTSRQMEMSKFESQSTWGIWGSIALLA